MTLALRYAVRSDVGLLREGNEDSAYAGPHLLAVADGMGGHAAGEVASAATITTIAALDDDRRGADLVDALADAVVAANMRLHELIAADPAIEGMGTTLTALLWADGYGALGHIGDSRAYLLRDGQFVQITHDHTLVQSLVDEGKISEDDVATHPHRSLLLRALDGRTVAEPDLTPIETLPGDRYLLCSDGLSGVVTEQTLHMTLSSIRDPDKAALQLVELAIRGGGPDNITCIVADVIDTQASSVPPTWNPVMAGSAAHGAPDPRPPARPSSPASRAMRLTRTSPQPAVPDEAPAASRPGGRGNSGTSGRGYREGYTGAFDTTAFAGVAAAGGGGDRGGGSGTASFDRPDFDGPGPDRDGPGQEDERGGRHRGRPHPEDDEDEDTGDDYGQHARRRWPIVSAALVVLALLLGGGSYGAWWYNQRQFYVGEQDGYVAIYRGTNQSLAGINLSSLQSRSTLSVAKLGLTYQDTLADTISKRSLIDAQGLIDRLQGEVDQCQRQWALLAAWQTRSVRYQSQLAAVRQSRARVKPRVTAANPGLAPPAPDAANCAPSAEFGIQASQLPGSTVIITPPAPPAPAPSATKAARPSATPAPRVSSTRKAAR